MSIPRRLLSNAGRAARLGFARYALRQRPFVLRLRLGSPVPELAPPPFLAGAEPSLSLLDALLVLERAARDPDVAAVVVRSEGPPGHRRHPDQRPGLHLCPLRPRSPGVSLRPMFSLPHALLFI